MYGHKKIFVIGWIWFSVWSMIGGFGYMFGNVKFFSICRAFQGIGPALLVPNAIALLGMNFRIGTQRNTAFACFGAAGPTGAAIGAIFTALITDLGWYPWCLWVLSIICMIVCGLSIIIIPGNVFQSSPLAARPSFDYWGCLTGVSGLVLVNFALNQAPLDGWTTWYITFLLILGFVFLFAFVTVELNYTKHPLIPIRGLCSEAYFALGCIAAGWGSHGIWIYYLYLFVRPKFFINKQSMY
jgi:MFS family permease